MQRNNNNALAIHARGKRIFVLFPHQVNILEYGHREHKHQEQIHQKNQPGTGNMNLGNINFKSKSPSNTNLAQKTCYPMIRSGMLQYNAEKKNAEIFTSSIQAYCMLVSRKTLAQRPEIWDLEKLQRNDPKLLTSQSMYFFSHTLTNILLQL